MIGLPSQLRCGDTWKWDDDAPALPDGTQATAPDYDSTTEFQGPQKFKVDAADDGSSFTSTVAAATTAEYPAGTYRWIRYVTTGSERYTIASGSVELLPDLATVQGGYDARSHASRMVTLIEDALEKFAVDAVQELEINGRRYVKADVAVLKGLLNGYKNEVAAENAQSGKRRKILMRFQTTS